MMIIFAALLLAKVDPPQLGVELSDRPSAYIDLGPWTRRFTKPGTQSPCNDDADGYPTEDGSTVLMDDRAFPAWAPPIDDPVKKQPKEAGVYTLRFFGAATVAPADGCEVIVGQTQYSSAKNETTCTVELKPDMPDLIVLSFTNTKRTPSSPAHSGISDLHFYRPGYDASSATQVFTHDLYNAIKPFQYLRFMGWTEANYASGFYGDQGHHLLSWNSRNLPDQPVDRPGDQPHGIPWEYVVTLANRSHKDVWINIPIAATGESPDDSNSYIYQLATLLKNGDAFTGKKGLDPALHVYIEHSNEVWNFGFSQYIWNKLAAIDEVGKGNSVLNRDGSTDQEQWSRRRHALRLYQIAKIFERVFGTGSLINRIRPIYAGWTIQPDAYQEVLEWMKNSYGPPASYFYGLAETAYFNDQKAAKDASPQQVLDAMQADSDNDRANTSRLRQIATQFALKLCAYEAGPDTGGGNPVNVGNRILANRLPEMEKAVIKNFRDNFFDLGGDMASYFALSSSYSRYGTWGAVEDLSDLDTPKYRAVLELSRHPSSDKELTSRVTGSVASPTGVQAQALVGRQVQISWTGGKPGSYYAVWYTTGGNFLIAAQGLTGTTYLHQHLDPGLTYTYYVTASLKGQNSPPSAQVQVRPVN